MKHCFHEWTCSAILQILLFMRSVKDTEIPLSAVFWYECNSGLAEKFCFVLFLNVEVQINVHHVGMT